MWGGIGPKSADRLRSRGYKTIGDLASADMAELTEYFGKNAEDMQRRASGIDHSPIHTSREAKSVSNEITFDEDSDDIEFLKSKIMALSDKVAWRLRQDNLAGKVISIKIRYSDFTTFTRQKALANHTNVGGDEIFETAYELFLVNFTHGRPVRLLGVGASNLEEPFTQLELFGDNTQKKQDLVQAVDLLRDKFGKNVIVRANQLKKNNNNGAILWSCHSFKINFPKKKRWKTCIVPPKI